MRTLKCTLNALSNDSSATECNMIGRRCRFNGFNRFSGFLACIFSWCAAGKTRHAQRQRIAFSEAAAKHYVYELRRGLHACPIDSSQVKLYSKGSQGKLDRMKSVRVGRRSRLCAAGTRVTGGPKCSRGLGVTSDHLDRVPIP